MTTASTMPRGIAPVAIYCDEVEERILIWKIDFSTGRGYHAPTIDMSFADAEAAGIPTDENLLLEEFDGVQLWRLTTGEYQINTRYPTEYKDWIYVWDTCLPANQYLSLAR